MYVHSQLLKTLKYGFSKNDYRDCKGKMKGGTGERVPENLRR